MPKESELTEEYGVSRTSVREAMKVLAAKGLVEIRQKIGTRVRGEELWSVFDSDILRWYAMQGSHDVIMRDLIEIRQILEPAARTARGRALRHDRPPADRAGLPCDGEPPHKDHEGYASSDVEFHMAVYGGSHNALMHALRRLVRRLHAAQLRRAAARAVGG